MVVTETVVIDGREIIVTPEAKVIYEAIKELTIEIRRSK